MAVHKPIAEKLSFEVTIKNVTYKGWRRRMEELLLYLVLISLNVKKGKKIKSICISRLKKDLSPKRRNLVKRRNLGQNEKSH